MKTPILETERLLLRPMKASDAEEVYRNWTSDPEVATFMRWSTHPNVEATREWLASEEQEEESDLLYDWGIVFKETGELIGSGGLSWSEEKQVYELGYNLMRKYWGRGLMTEAAKKMVEYGVQELNAKKIFGCHAVDNPASGRVMEKLGFRYYGNSSYQSFDKQKKFDAKEYLLVVE